MRYYPPRITAEVLGYTPKHLRRLAEQGKIGCIRTQSGHRRYDVESYIDKNYGATGVSHTTLCYVQAATAEEKAKLKRQTLELRKHVPAAEMIFDIGAKTKDAHGRNILQQKLADGERLCVIMTPEATMMKKMISGIYENGGKILILTDGETRPFKEKERSSFYG